jgi:hypothetical protein
MGRVMHPSFIDGAQPVSASVTTARGHAHIYSGKQRYTAARCLQADEIPDIVADYATAARNALEVGFDGVQLHASNGYLIDQFLRDSSNFRTDAYGGSIANRIRLLAEVTQAIADAVVRTAPVCASRRTGRRRECATATHLHCSLLQVPSRGGSRNSRCAMPIHDNVSASAILIRSRPRSVPPARDR